MGVFRVEPADGVFVACACCGSESILRGFVFEDDAPRAVYFVERLGVPKYPVAKIGVAIGDWSDGATASSRLVFAFLCRPSSAGIHLASSDSESLAIQELEPLGAAITSDGLDRHPRRREFQTVVEAIIDQDWRLDPIRAARPASHSNRLSAEEL